MRINSINNTNFYTKRNSILKFERYIFQNQACDSFTASNLSFYGVFSNKNKVTFPKDKIISLVNGSEECCEKIGEVATQAREYTNAAMMVGFGIGSPEAAVKAAEKVDGVIVGSAVVKRLQDGNYDEAMDLINSIRTALDAKYFS